MSDLRTGALTSIADAIDEGSIVTYSTEGPDVDIAGLLRLAEEHIEELEAGCKASHVLAETTNRQILALVKDARTLAEALQKHGLRLGDARTSPWISVDDRLPEGSPYFFVRNGTKLPLVAWWDRDTERFYENGHLLSVTHWMEIPE